ncbi:MAG TPA: hypothetical protein VEB40_14040 [Flavipsychrobacter sp.]|nr:hypothetical protein [Flavipsychrobacter sp.]
MSFRTILSSVLLLLAASACRKDPANPAQLANTNTDSAQTIDSSLTMRHTQNMAGTYTFKKYRHQNGNYNYLLDTSFSIAVLNDTTISLWGYQLPYSRSGLIGSINGSGIWMPADTTEYLLFGAGGNGVLAVEYYYDSDSIVIHNLSAANFDRYLAQ